MKGCLVAIGVIFLLVILLLVGGGGYLVYKGRQVAQETEAAVAALHATNQEFAFDEPADGILSEARLALFLGARREAAGPLARLMREVELLEGRKGRSMGKWETLKAAFGVFGGTLQLFREVPCQLTAAIRRRGMSFAEYLWITTTVHATLIEASNDGDPEARKAVEVVESAQSILSDGSREGGYRSMRKALESLHAEWLPENLELILKHADELTAAEELVQLDAVLFDQFVAAADQTQVTEEGK